MEGTGITQCPFFVCNQMLANAQQNTLASNMASNAVEIRSNLKNHGNNHSSNQVITKYKSKEINKRKHL